MENNHWMTNEKHALISSKEPTLIRMMKKTTFIIQSRMATAFMPPLLLQRARSPRRQDARLHRKPHQQKMFCVPSFVDIPSMEVNQQLTDTQPIKSSVNKLELFTGTLDSHLKNKRFLN
jgi:hypothetical protein